MDGGGKIIHQPPGSSSQGGKGGSPSGDNGGPSHNNNNYHKFSRFAFAALQLRSFADIINIIVPFFYNTLYKVIKARTQKIF